MDYNKLNYVVAKNILSEWEEIAFFNEKEFIKRFCQEGSELIKISWGSETVYIVYMLDCGQHIANSFSIEDWIEFASEFGDKKSNVKFYKSK